MGLFKMLSDLMKRVVDFFKPYTLDQFIEDNDPQTDEDIVRLEKQWHHYCNARTFTGY